MLYVADLIASALDWLSSLLIRHCGLLGTFVKGSAWSIFGMLREH